MRRTPALAAAVLVATAIGTVLTSCSGSDAAQEQGQALVNFGGPAGWHPDATQRPVTDDSSAGTVDGVPVILTAGDQPRGVRVTWVAPTTSADAAARCGQLVAWFDDAARAWPSTIDTSTLRATCVQDVAGTGHPILAAGAGPAHGAYGRVTYAASVAAGELVATLEFNATA